MVALNHQEDIREFFVDDENCFHDDEQQTQRNQLHCRHRTSLQSFTITRSQRCWLWLFCLLRLAPNWNNRAVELNSLCTTSRNFENCPYGVVDPTLGLFVYAQDVGMDGNESNSDKIDSSRRIKNREKIEKHRTFPEARAVPTAASQKETLTFNQILYRAGKRGLGGGIPGAIAGAIQVLSLMWLRTIINYQCRYGTTFSQALRTLLQDGGVGRLYRGLSFALIQAPLARFVSTAANDGIESLLSNLAWTKDWGPARTTVVASVVVGLWRMLLMPIDTMKTVLQVDSVEGFRSLMRRVRAGKISVLYSGAIANAIAAIFAHYPWFFTFNLLSGLEWVKKLIPKKLIRNAGIGIVSSVASDTVVNAMRVIKTTKQSLGSKQSASYADTIKIILAADGWRGLFGRSLRTRILANALQSIIFTVVWRSLTDWWKGENATFEE